MVKFFSARVYLLGSVVSSVFVRVAASIPCTKPFSNTLVLNLWLLVKVVILSSSGDEFQAKS